MTAYATTRNGFRLLPEYFDRVQQADLAAQVMGALQDAPLFTPSMPRTGKPLSVQMSNFGPLGWVADRSGYRYEARHPVTGTPWPAMPQALLELWEAVSGWPEPPQACLINVYGPQSRLGLHIDADEDAREAPVVSVSLGDRARFRLGGPQRSSPTRSLFLSSGDVVVLGGASRRFFHGVDRIYPGTSTLLSGPFSPGRINLTMRRVHTGGGAGTTRS
ncbi:alkylated DNA repair dioxygenase [Glycocaulis albus]|jgi:alkylated DNA repair protein (DNA oxidative demethylase)|uniref:Alkylated DNA repair dioxygenase n=1 Tax=Glycocaulis albus TaxID=1382801 RepID=A0ABQ1XKC8_9PROT|nr:alpha-ketoglutarate-dependent dioxygenase AlkB [Glycocaulis albus]MBV5258504.1 alpha-ketoglutarate-dependent dioxygenase AlkB [Synechococcus moorigangaii CMS01]GGG95904.1 alkylated DNA repair dioxygenase [Glycocaulis albus]